jgi:hypothetical protein
MSTKAQTKANRQNAQKSTGPRTAEGKDVVSQNAVKHGLFAESVIKGENEADYEAFHDKMLAELAPVGMVEFMLAERVVSLWWRLKRAERMQNQVIDEMIERKIDNPLSKRLNMINCHAKGIKLGDPRYVIGHLQLGKIATQDWSSGRVLDRMLMYERRIENSVIKIMKELKRCQIMRRIEQHDADQQPAPAIPIPINDNRDEAATRSTQAIHKRGTGFQPVENMAGHVLSGAEGMAMPLDQTYPSPRDKAATRPAEKECDLKKQTQFAPAQVDVKSFMKGDYDNKPAGRIEENKANQSQLLLSPPRTPSSQRF